MNIGLEEDTKFKSDKEISIKFKTETGATSDGFNAKT